MKTLQTFVAIDFETANSSKSSACACGWVTVVEGDIVEQKSSFIEPGEVPYTFSSLHGIHRVDVRGAPPFREVWEEIDKVRRKHSAYYVAHNEEFERAVVHAHKLKFGAPVICTLQLSRATWGIRPTSLPAVCHRLNIPLEHHNPRSDAHAAAQIVLRALSTRKGQYSIRASLLNSNCDAE